MPADPRPDRSALLAEVVRSGFVEGHHRGSLLALAADGSRVLALGDPDAAVFPRSSNKPMQAVGMLEAGLDLDGELLALACASHSGEPFHLDGVRRVLAAAGLDETALRTPPDWPVDEVEKQRADRGRRAAGADPDELLRQARRDAGHLRRQRLADRQLPRRRPPAAEALRATVERLAGEPVAGRRRRRLRRAAVRAVPGRAGPRVRRDRHGAGRHARAPGRRAIRSHPEWLGGTRRDVTQLVAGVPGLIAKDGAEGVYAAALPDGRAVALKVDDGGQRARPPVMVAALRALGVDAPVLAELAEDPLLGGGQPVGSVRVAFDA